MKEEVKYVCQEGPLLVAEKKSPTSVYQETTVADGRTGGNMTCYDKYCTASFCSRLRLAITVLALAACVAVIIILLSNGIHASNDRETAQEEEIKALKEKLDTQQIRLHRMQKELQFLVSRERSVEAREDLARRRQHSPDFFRQISSIKSDPDIVESDLPEAQAIPKREIWDNDEEIDVDKLPIASPSKRFRQGKLPADLTIQN